MLLCSRSIPLRSAFRRERSSICAIASARIEEMSFLDNLENNLKSLETGQESADEAQRQQRERTQQRANAQAVAPFAEELKKGPYTAELLRQTTRIGHEMRVKVHVAWLGS